MTPTNPNRSRAAPPWQYGSNQQVNPPFLKTKDSQPNHYLLSDHKRARTPHPRPNTDVVCGNQMGAKKATSPNRSSTRRCLREVCNKGGLLLTPRHTHKCIKHASIYVPNIIMIYLMLLRGQWLDSHFFLCLKPRGQLDQVGGERGMVRIISYSAKTS
jgi:hypothetical protein